MGFEQWQALPSKGTVPVIQTKNQHLQEISVLDDHIKELEKKMGLRDGKKKKKLHNYINKEGYGEGFCGLLDGIDGMFEDEVQGKEDTKYKPRKASDTDDEDPFVGRMDMDSSEQEFSDADIESIEEGVK
jgi:hypothetical protein